MMRLATKHLDDRPLLDKFKASKHYQRDHQFKMPFLERKKAVENMLNILNDNKEELANILCEETKKPITQARNEIVDVTDNVNFFLEETTKILRDAEQTKISFEPLGVIAHISAWNYPYYIGLNTIVPALLLGNAVIYKPSEHATNSGLCINGIIQESGFPKDIMVCVTGDGTVGESVANLPVNGLYFTGSYNTGSKIGQKGFVNNPYKRLQLELGGKDAGYVHHDVDLDDTVEKVVMGAFSNAGQSCSSLERLYIHADIYDNFVDKLINRIKKLKIGSHKDEETFIGPLTLGEKHVKKLLKYIKDAKEKGGIVLTGNKSFDDKNGYYLEPTVLANTNHKMIAMTEECFGPILCIAKVDSPEEAVELINDSEYGLTASIFTKNYDYKPLLSSLQVGTVYLNTCDESTPRLPWTGRKNSGIGCTLSSEGITAFARTKYWYNGDTINDTSK